MFIKYTNDLLMFNEYNRQLIPFMSQWNSIIFCAQDLKRQHSLLYVLLLIEHYLHYDMHPGC